LVRKEKAEEKVARILAEKERDSLRLQLNQLLGVAAA